MLNSHQTHVHCEKKNMSKAFLAWFDVISYLLTINDVKGFIVTKTVSRRKSFLAGFKFLNQLNQTARPD